MSKDNKKPFYKKFWFWALVLLAIIILANAGGDKPSTDSQTTSNSPTTQTENKKWDGAAFHDAVQNGQTKAEVDALANGKKPSCYESTTEGVGVMNICSYGNLFTDKQAVSVTFMNDAVYSKSRQTN
jgi:hypothetical protein